MRGRRKYEIDRYPNEAVLVDKYMTTIRTRGNNRKTAMKFGTSVNVADPVSKKIVNSKILQVVRNPANRDYERRGVISRGALLETESGMARVVSRPGRDGCINAVLMKQ
jgi:small subunit ribosomal protein S8e